MPLPDNSKQPLLQVTLKHPCILPARPPSEPYSPAVPFKGDGAQEGGCHLWVLWYKAKGVLRDHLCWGMVLTKADLAPPAIKEPHMFQTVPAPSPETSAQSQQQPTLDTKADAPCCRLQLLLGPVLKYSGLPKEPGACMEPALPHTMLRMWCPKSTPMLSSYLLPSFLHFWGNI